jgi:hypothetical protein
VRDAVAHILDSTTLADVILEVDKAKEMEAHGPMVSFNI